MAERHARAAHARWRHLTPGERLDATAKARAARERADRDEALHVLAEDAGYSGPFPSAVVDEVVVEIRRERMTRLAHRSVAVRQAKRLQVAA